MYSFQIKRIHPQTPEEKFWGRFDSAPRPLLRPKGGCGPPLETPAGDEGTKDRRRGSGTPYLGHGLRRPNFVPKFGASVRSSCPTVPRGAGNGGRGNEGTGGHRPPGDAALNRPAQRPYSPYQNTGGAFRKSPNSVPRAALLSHRAKTEFDQLSSSRAQSAPLAPVEASPHPPVGHDDLTDAPNSVPEFGWRRPCPRYGVPRPPSSAGPSTT